VGVGLDWDCAGRYDNHILSFNSNDIRTASSPRAYTKQTLIILRHNKSCRPAVLDMVVVDIVPSHVTCAWSFDRTGLLPVVLGRSALLWRGRLTTVVPFWTGFLVPKIRKSGCRRRPHTCTKQTLLQLTTTNDPAATLMNLANGIRLFNSALAGRFELEIKRCCYYYLKSLKRYSVKVNFDFFDSNLGKPA